MNHVSWHESAYDQLADIYVGLTPAVREALAKAVAEVNRRLERNGANEGESRGPDSRVFMHEYLVVFFKTPLNGLIRVTGVRPNRRTRPYQ